MIAAVALVVLAVGARAAEYEAVAEHLRTRLGMVFNATAERGEMTLFDFSDCDSQPNCLAINPTSSYLMVHMPSDSAGQYAGTCNLSDQTRPGLDNCFRIRSDEAVVIVGRTPPSCRYFSLQSYVHDRYYPEDESWLQVYASFGDTTFNVLRVNLDGDDAPFNELFVSVHTANPAIVGETRRALAELGLEGILNADPLPAASEARMSATGPQDHTDIFSILVRLALFEDEDAGNEYEQNPPVSMFLLSPTTPRDPEELYGLTPLIDRASSSPNENLLKPAQDAVVKKAIEVFAADGYVAHAPEELENLLGQRGLDSGLDCMEAKARCAGENRDTVYHGSSSFKMDPSGSVSGAVSHAIVVGAHHLLTGKAVYMGFSVQHVLRKAGILSVPEADVIGSADALDAGLDTSDLFAVVLARDCNLAAVRELGLYCAVVDTDWPGVPLERGLEVVVRAYLNPETTVGPAPEELLAPVMVLFE